MRTRKSTKISYKFEKIRVQVESEHLLSKALGGSRRKKKHAVLNVFMASKDIHT